MASMFSDLHIGAPDVYVDVDQEGRVLVTLTSERDPHVGAIRLRFTVVEAEKLVDELVDTLAHMGGVHGTGEDVDAADED